MSQTVKGVIARSKGAEVELVDVVVPDPGPNDVIVRVQACGVCHTDLAYRDGGINDEYPFLLGHEPQASWRRSEIASPTWPRATSWSSTGARCAVSAAPASVGSNSTASPPITRRRK